MLKRILGAYTFRFMILYVTGLSVAVFFLLSLTYAFYSYNFFSEIDRTLDEELDFFEQQYLDAGIVKIQPSLEQNKVPSKFDRFSYLIVDSKQEKITGDLQQWPEYISWADGWLSFYTDMKNGQGKEQNFFFLARIRSLSNGQTLMVARISEDVRQNVQLVLSTLLWSMLITMIMGLIGGFFTTMVSIRRVEMINNVLDDIKAGNLSERISVESPVDDFQLLAENINLMLNRIEGAVNDVRQVTNNIAHDLRTPLTRLRNKLSTLEKRSAPENTEMVTAMLAESDNLLATFNALLRISQIEFEAKRENFAEANLSMILQDVIELYEPLASDKNLDLGYHIDDKAILEGDRDMLFQMLANLMDNAIKYTPSGGDVYVSLVAEQDSTEIIFTDTGLGIPEDKYEDVFQRFFRVEQSRGDSPGNGLGLSLVRAVLQLHQGKIRLSANKPQGLVVKVSLNNTKAHT